MANHQDRLARRQRANEELQARLAARNAAFDALDSVAEALQAVARAASGGTDPVTRAERTRIAMNRVDAALSDLRERADGLRTSEQAKASEIADLIGVPSARLFMRRAGAANAKPSDSLAESRELRAAHDSSADHELYQPESTARTGTSGVPPFGTRSAD